jgi:DNA-binding beta-propeller fold protein YncE
MFLSACLLALLPGAAPELRTVALALAADGKSLFVCARGGTDKDSSVFVWDLEKPGLKAVVPNTPGTVRAIQPTADGKRFVLVVGTARAVHRIEVRDAGTGKVLHRFDGAEGAASTAAVSPDGKWVAYRAATEKAPLSVWNTETGQRAEELEKAAAQTPGVLAFSPNSKRLAVCSSTRYAEYDVATGKQTVNWDRDTAKSHALGQPDMYLAVLPGGKGVVTVSATARRRPSFNVRIRTEKKDQYIAQLWDYAKPPIVSPDGRWLIVTGGTLSEGETTLVFKLDADGAAELDDKPEKPLIGNGKGNKVPAGGKWALGAMAEPVALAPNGKRLFVAQSGGRVAVFDAEKRQPTASLLATQGEKAGALPEWHILTAAGDFVASPAEAEALAKAGKVKDAEKVKDALGVK